MVKGLYAVTPDILNTELLCEKVAAALHGGASMVQYRNKAADASLRLRQATALLALCRSRGVPFIINDHLDLCATIDADGLHLGATDCDLGAARRLLGADNILGASCYNQFDLALSAQHAGANYVAFGACFASSTKPNAPVASLDLFTRAKKELAIPAVAIGGISLQNATLVIQQGASAIAVVNAIFDPNFHLDDVKSTAQQFSQLFT
jgi:thiamine-phosphate pyrophosphorylase